MEGYLRGYYGYKNFGDELLFFGVVKRLSVKYPLTKLFVEVGNVSWMEDRVRENYQGFLTEKQLKSIKFINAKQHKYKIITHLINLLGRGKYKKVFKFFGGGEVLSDERDFPHDGRNIPLLFNYSVRHKQFVLLGGIGKIRKSWTETLYRYLLPKAEMIVVRDRESYAIATQGRNRDEEKGTRGKGISGRGENQINNNVVLYQDFAQEIILKYQGTREQGVGTRDEREGPST
ncbi:MAG TPA: polysaccharide pyruvyl transferase family protein, partial [Candidatus Absconditabacterales bacterium]|nr:polysaccharide pyruvyl transferase family protein [Candidatus Absconditabacterales bacterium]